MKMLTNLQIRNSKLTFRFKPGQECCIHITFFDSLDGANANTFGNFINDSKVSANCRGSVVIRNKIPHLCFFALEDLEEGEELRYDYKDDPKALWWRKMVRNL